jgi:DNA-binding PucR family transcriptional regulator
MKLRDLLDAPGLGLEPLHGDDAAWERPVRWVYTTDLPDPSRYLTGGELVITGLVWRTSAADTERFVSAIAAADAAGLAAGDAVFGTVPADVVEACERHGVPLIRVTEDVSFARVTEFVVGAVSAARGARLAATVGRQRQLLAAVAEGRGLDELAQRVSRETGLVCRVLTPTGRCIVAGPAALAPADLDRATAAFLAADRLPAVTKGTGKQYSVFAVGPALGQRVTSRFLLVDGAWNDWPTELVEVVGELAAIAALDRTMQHEATRVPRMIGEEALARVASGAGGQPETLVRLQQAGMDVGQPIAVATATFEGRPDLAETARSVLADAASHLGTPIARAEEDGTATALVPASSGGFVDALRTALARLAPGTGRTRLLVGISQPAEPGALSGALEEARFARVLAGMRTGPVSVVASTEVTSHVLLLATVPDDVRRAFAGRVLGPVLEYDEAHHAGLVSTLTAFLDCSGSWSRTAQQLDLHVNTVRYRIGRVEELTGRDLSRLDERVDVFLALRSL